MKRILDIGHTDLRLFLKHKSAYIWLFGIPLAFVYFMGFANRGPGDPANPKPELAIENQDTQFLGRVFLDELDAQGMRLLSPTNSASSARAIRIPADFTARVLERKSARVIFSRNENSAESDAALVELRLVRGLVALNGHILEAVTLPGSASTNGTPKLTEARLRAVLAQPDPVRFSARFAGRKPVPSGFNFSLPGNLVMYLTMNLLIFGGTSLATERRNGVIKRLMACPVTRFQIVMGKVYGLMLLGAAQILFLLAAGKFAFGVNLGANLPGVTLILLVFAWVVSSMGLLAGSLLGSDDRVIGTCVLVSILMAALGGCWWPLELGPPALRSLSLCFPTGWALEALHQLISFGSGLPAVWGPLAALLGFGMVANLLAIRLFRN